MQIYFTRVFFLLFMTLYLSGCVDLSGGGSAAEKKARLSDKQLHNSKQRNAAEQDGEVHTMRGGLGIFSTGMNQLRDSAADEYMIPSSSAMWYNAGHVTHSIEREYYAHKKHRPIILVGHSLGANEQIKVARNLNRDGIPVALLITVDAVSQTIVPPNVKEVLNVYKPGYVPMFSGLKLRAVDPQKTHIDNINAATIKGIGVNHFTIDKEKVVQEMMMARIRKVIKEAKNQG
jgi:hypothetical protein